MKIHHEYSSENSFGNIFLKKPPKKSLVMKILAPRNPSAASRQGSNHDLVNFKNVKH